MKNIFMLSVILLAGCQSSGIPLKQMPNAPIASEQCDQTNGYCINFNKTMNNRGWTDNWTNLYGQKTDHTISNGKNPEDMNYVRADFTSHEIPCSPSLIGTPDLEEFSGINGKAVWGRIGVTNVYDDYDDAVCAPPIAYPSTSEEKDAAWKGEFRTERAAYALCSEKDGKTVVICISQMQDDPQLAQEIFETFRWTE